MRSDKSSNSLTAPFLKKKFQITDRIRSFKFAFAGILTMLKTQHNAWVHLCAATGVIALGFFLNISQIEWCFIILSIMAVCSAEALNTAFEFLADAASPDFHPLVKNAKDVAAGAVLITAICSVIIGLLILVPHIEKLIN